MIALLNGIVFRRIRFADEVLQWRNYLIVINGKEHDNAVAGLRRRRGDWRRG